MKQKWSFGSASRRQILNLLTPSSTFFFFFSWRCKLWYIEWINSKVLLNSTGNYIQYLIITYNGKEFEKWLDSTAILLTQTFSSPGFVLLCQHICILSFQAKSLRGILTPHHSTASATASPFHFSSKHAYLTSLSFPCHHCFSSWWPQWPPMPPVLLTHPSPPSTSQVIWVFSENPVDCVTALL